MLSFVYRMSKSLWKYVLYFNLVVHNLYIIKEESLNYFPR